MEPKVEKQFKKTDLMALWLGEEVAGFTPISDVQTGSGRWESHHLFVFQHEGQYYGFVYFRGLTECQEADKPFEHDGDFVTVKAYAPRIVQEISWIAVESLLPVEGTVTASQEAEPESK